jgi:hypothetical protein
MTTFHVGGRSPGNSRHWVYSFSSMFEADAFVAAAQDVADHHEEWMARQAAAIEWQIFPIEEDTPANAYLRFLETLRGA